MTLNATDADQLEKMLGDDCKCESEHEVTACSFVVVARASHCLRPEPFLVCQNWVNRGRRLPFEHCALCDMPVAVCERVIPV